MLLAPAPESSTTDPLVVAIVSVTLTLAISLLTTIIARQSEHSKWLRERRFDAYVAFMTDMAAIGDLASTVVTPMNQDEIRERTRAISDKYMSSFEQVSILGPRKVNAAGQVWVWASTAHLRDKTQTTAEANSTARWNFLVVAGKTLKSNNVSAEPLKAT